MHNSEIAAPHTPSPAAPPAVALRVGQRLGPYRLCVELGTGGMATVYLAHREGVSGSPSGRWGYFAVKCARPHLVQDPAFVAMFRDEARIASWIHHGNVCSVFDFDVCDGTYYLAMEYLSGQTLKAVLHKLATTTPFTPASWHACVIARIIADAAEGLHAAHELRDEEGLSLGVVHRDVSPENIFLTYDGNVKLMDFGLVRALDQLHETRTGIVKGKYGYMQPEVLQGKKPDRRADIFSLGIVLWELLTARRLFAHDTEAGTLHAITNGEIVPPSTICESLPPELDAIVMRALERDPDARYPNARAMARDLTRFIANAGHGVGLADLADMMDRLFPGGAECDRQLLAVAHQIEEASVAWELAASPPPRTGDSASAATSSAPSLASRVSPRNAPLALAAALVVGLAVGGSTAWSLGDHSAAVPTARPQLVSASMQASTAPLDSLAPPRAPMPPPAVAPSDPSPPAVVVRPVSSRGRRIEVLGQDDLASGEMLLRLRVVGDEDGRAQPRKHRK
ncbi:MAG TPA: serine/threonine-protein kinase [Nannocystaceae bacterium]|nr:serine/threonine-protein kinase [Nannocystaceae bacterium]